MSTQSSFIENNISKPLVGGIITAASTYIPAVCFSVNPLVAAVFAATYSIALETTTNALTYSLNSFGFDKKNHKITYLLTNSLSFISGIFAAYYTTLKVIGTVTFGSYPISFMLTSYLILGGVVKLLTNWNFIPNPAKN